MKALDDRDRVARTIEEVRIAERDVLGAGTDLRSDVGHYDVDRDHAEPAVVHRHDRTVAAAMLAAAAGFRVADDSSGTAKERWDPQ